MTEFDPLRDLVPVKSPPGEWCAVLADPQGDGPAADRTARLQACADAVLDGRVARDFPDSEGRRIRILTRRGKSTAEAAVGTLAAFSRDVLQSQSYREAIARSPHVRDLSFESDGPGPRPRRAAAFAMQPIQTVMAFAHQYERHFSALSLAGGYGFDSYTFGRIDHASTHIVFLAYLAVAGIAIAVSHRLESRPPERQPSERTRTILTAITQFALGCLLSGFCVFYLRSASLWASWPYLLVLAGIFIGNEFFKKYTTRFALALLLYFFALLSYAILVVPVLLATIGTIPFVASSIVALVLFSFYGNFLRSLGRERFRQVRIPVLAGVLAIAATVNVFYFVKILPPLPLALADAGVYHAAKKVGDAYEVVEEPQPWTTLLGDRPIEHIDPNDRLYLYAAVFAPGRLDTTIVHRWEWFDPRQRRWLLQSRTVFAIHGGRDAGYRAYSYKLRPKDGDWRVNITTTDGRLLGRIRFAVVHEAPPQSLQTKVLR